MSKFIKKLITGLLFSSSVFLFSFSPCLAADNTTTTVQFVPVQDGYYAVAGTEAADIETSYRTGLAIMDSAYKEAGGLSYLNVRFLHKGGTYTMVLSAADVQTLQTMHAQTNSWLAQNMPAIVPAGSTKQNAVKLTADWIADHMTYDHSSMLDRKTLISYQNAMSCFTKGKGVCTTYATAFDAMVNYLPFNAAGTVDYTCAAPVHKDTKLVTNDEHAWSAILESDGWHLYDVTFYDNDDKARKENYLDMSLATTNDGYHSNIRTNFSALQAIAYSGK
ncbi:MAG: hypothetical protein IKQ88_05520 [Lachnospiraceae bacterium]|nr:hypothetical protein [Lachnospiraceae bacterium]